jgi:hypothetical protein
MEIEVQLDGIDATEQTTFALQDWLRQERIAGLKIEPKRGTPKPGEMGAELMTILSIVLAAPAIVQLVRSIHVWIQTRKPKVSLKVKTGATEVTINAENIDNQEAFVENVLSSLKLKST